MLHCGVVRTQPSKVTSVRVASAKSGSSSTQSSNRTSRAGRPAGSGSPPSRRGPVTRRQLDPYAATAPSRGSSELAVLERRLDQLGPDAAYPLEPAVGPAGVLEVGLGEVGTVEQAVEEPGAPRVRAEEVGAR